MAFPLFCLKRRKRNDIEHITFGAESSQVFFIVFAKHNSMELFAEVGWVKKEREKKLIAR